MSFHLEVVTRRPIIINPKWYPWIEKKYINSKWSNSTAWRQDSTTIHRYFRHISLPISFVTLIFNFWLFELLTKSYMWNEQASCQLWACPSRNRPKGMVWDRQIDGRQCIMLPVAMCEEIFGQIQTSQLTTLKLIKVVFVCFSATIYFRWVIDFA